MRLCARMLVWARRVFGPKERVVKRYPLPRANLVSPSVPAPRRSHSISGFPPSAGGPPPVSPQPGQTPPSPRGIGRTREPPPLKTDDDIVVCLDDLAISVRRKTDVCVPFEVTVVVPRAEITEKYQEGVMVEKSLVYSSITVAHSPRYEPMRR